ncbi:MAG: AbiH family protein, partial [Bacteroidota bacterium]|jgi:hypothetical protein
MKQLVIIGNGFDLAHGLKTGYMDFILWYLNKRLAAIVRGENYEDSISIIKYDGFSNPQDVTDVKSIEEYLGFIKRWTRLSGKSSDNAYFPKLLHYSVGKGWVDIEAFYFAELLKVFDLYSRERRNEDYLKLLNLLNNFMRGLQEQMLEYLSIQESIGSLKPIDSFYERCAKNANGHPMVFLNFNYTDTISIYRDKFNEIRSQTIFIHGQLSNPQNPIIFGYGDERDEKYKQMEDTGIDEFLTFIKSFGYLKTNNYRRVIEFIESGPYQVRIVGHSCGLSDRVLLSELFTNPNCKNIDILYHKRDDGSDDYTQKLYAISRQFPHDFKEIMRRRIIPFEDSIPLGYGRDEGDALSNGIS